MQGWSTTNCSWQRSLSMVGTCGRCGIAVPRTRSHSRSKWPSISSRSCAADWAMCTLSRISNSCTATYPRPTCCCHIVERSSLLIRARIVATGSRDTFLQHEVWQGLRSVAATSRVDGRVSRVPAPTFVDEHRYTSLQRRSRCNRPSMPARNVADSVLSRRFDDHVVELHGHVASPSTGIAHYRALDAC